MTIDALGASVPVSVSVSISPDGLEHLGVLDVSVPGTCVVKVPFEPVEDAVQIHGFPRGLGLHVA